MKTYLAEVTAGPAMGGRDGRRLRVMAGAFVVAAVLLVPAANPAFGQQAASKAPAAQAAPADQNATCIIGLEHIRHNAKGKLTVEGDALQFVTEKGTAKIPVASIIDVFAGKDDQQMLHGLGGSAVKAGVPYGGGRVLSLFSHEIGVLTVEYRDEKNGWHGAIFTLAKGQGTEFKRQLVEKGAKASIAPEAPGSEEKKP